MCTGEPGNSEYLEEFPLGFYLSSIWARVDEGVHFASLENQQFDFGGDLFIHDTPAVSWVRGTIDL